MKSGYFFFSGTMCLINRGLYLVSYPHITYQNCRAIIDGRIVQNAENEGMMPDYLFSYTPEQYSGNPE